MTIPPSLTTWKEADFLHLLKESTTIAQLTPVGELAFTYNPYGISAVLLLAESHVALHFWPDLGKVAIDIHVCDYQQENRHKAEKLATCLTIKLTGTSDITDWKYLAVTG